MLAKSRRNKLNNEEQLRAESFCSELKNSGLFTEKEQQMINVISEIKEQTLEEHISEIIAAFDAFPYKDRFDKRTLEMIRFCCAHHDDGKVDELFQRSLTGEKNDIEPHGHISILLFNFDDFTYECPHCNEEDYRICVTAIYHHHTRSRFRTKAELEEYANAYVLNNGKSYFNNPHLTINIDNFDKLLFVSEEPLVKDAVEFYKSYRRYQVVKGMLNTFDYMASADIDIQERPSDTEKTLVNAIHSRYSNLRPIQTYMKNNADRNIIVIGSTGIGKMEGGCLWANGDKTFYTMPMTVSATEIYRRIHDIYKFKNACVLHSKAMEVYLDSPDSDIDETLETISLLTYPFVVCTADQIFKFAFEAAGTERFAAAMSYSKVIIDELQSYSPKTVAAIIYALVQIVQMGGKFCIMTATLPKFFISRLARELKRIGRSDAMPCIETALSSGQRHMIEIRDGDFDYDSILEEGKHKKVLVICNTVDRCIAVSERLNGADCLHSRFLPLNRRSIEKKIMSFAEDDNCGIWVSTQIVEASLDIDFDIMFTESSTIDSLVQRMGRVNRKGRTTPESANIVIANNNNWAIYDKDICLRTINELRKHNNELLSEADKITMVDSVFDERALKRSNYYKEFDKTYAMLRDTLPGHFSKNEAEQLFRDIAEVISVIPERVYFEKKQDIDRLNEAPKGLTRGARRLIRSKLNELCISVRPKAFKTLSSGEVWKGTRTVCSQYDFDEEMCIGKGLLKDGDEAAVW